MEYKNIEIIRKLKVNIPIDEISCFIYQFSNRFIFFIQSIYKKWKFYVTFNCYLCHKSLTLYLSYFFCIFSFSVSKRHLFSIFIFNQSIKNHPHDSLKGNNNKILKPILKWVVTFVYQENDFKSADTKRVIMCLVRL